MFHRTIVNSHFDEVVTLPGGQQSLFRFDFQDLEPKFGQVVIGIYDGTGGTEPASVLSTQHFEDCPAHNHPNIKCIKQDISL